MANPGGPRPWGRFAPRLLAGIPSGVLWSVATSCRRFRRPPNPFTRDANTVCGELCRGSPAQLPGGGRVGRVSFRSAMGSPVKYRSRRRANLAGQSDPRKPAAMSDEPAVVLYRREKAIPGPLGEVHRPLQMRTSVRNRGGAEAALSHHHDWSGRRDLNSGPLPPQGSALPGCATARLPEGSYSYPTGPAPAARERVAACFERNSVWMPWIPVDPYTRNPSEPEPCGPESGNC